MNEKNNNFDDITVKSLLEEDEDFYVEKYIDCLDIDTITLTILSQPSKYDYVLNRVAKYCDNDAYVVPVVNGRTIEYISNELLKFPIDPSYDAQIYETKIILSTPAIETGKTISQLYICVDTGLQFQQLYVPLTYNQLTFYG